jgi:YHS domain-containing protein
MSQVKDLVCGMMIDSETAPARTTYASREFYFCSEDCRRAFEADPEPYAGIAEGEEPPYTKTKGFVAPKFGSAGSGGLEYEPSPEQRRGK